MELMSADHNGEGSSRDAVATSRQTSRTSASEAQIKKHKVSRAQLLTLNPARLPSLLTDDVINVIELEDQPTTPSADIIAPLLLTAQYCRPQLNSFDAWARYAGTTLHPGDVDAADVLQHIRQHRGIWIYWGHGEPDRLRGYGHIYSHELLASAPDVPQTATLLMTCNTLTADVNNVAIARDWFLGGHTRLLLAACKPVDTDANQAFSDALLAHLPQTATSFALWFRDALLSLDSDTRSHISDTYRLLGNAHQTVQFLTPGIQPKPAL